MINHLISAIKIEARIYSEDEWDRKLCELGVMLGWNATDEPAFLKLNLIGKKVLIKPNWVLHYNAGKDSLEPIITNPELIKAIVRCIARQKPATIKVGDAPLQSCDFPKVTEYGGISSWMKSAAEQWPMLLGPIDFRRTIASRSVVALVQDENVRPEDQYRIVDLAEMSALEPVADLSERFRVTQYDPRYMKERHAKGKHQYMIAGEVMEADVIINVPKLKTHKKAGLTCALKNLVGINGNKEFLPHHRKGSPRVGGDCYPRKNAFKECTEWLLDLQNATTSRTLKNIIRLPLMATNTLAKYQGSFIGTEGAWSGNDTVWRMVADLNRIAIYCGKDGEIKSSPQRRLIHIVDAITAGQGDGPLASDRFDLGILLGGNDAACVDWIASKVLGYDPRKIFAVSKIFELNTLRITTINPREIECVWSNGEHVELSALPKPTLYPEGWIDCLEKREDREKVYGITRGSWFKKRALT